MTERTFSIIKPDATRRDLTGAINAVIEKGGLRIVAQKRLQLDRVPSKKNSMRCMRRGHSTATW